MQLEHAPAGYTCECELFTKALFSAPADPATVISNTTMVSPTTIVNFFTACGVCPQPIFFLVAIVPTRTCAAFSTRTQPINPALLLVLLAPIHGEAAPPHTTPQHLSPEVLRCMSRISCYLRCGSMPTAPHPQPGLVNQHTVNGACWCALPKHV